MRLTFVLAALVLSVSGARAQDPRQIVQKSVELDQANWLRMKDYTWIARETERHLDGSGRAKSEESKEWETVVIYGQPHRRMLKQLTADEQRREQGKLDKALVKLQRETPEQRERRLAKDEKEREKDREFLREVPDLYDFHLEGEQKIEETEVWVITATPKSGYKPKDKDAAGLLKVRGKLWIDKAEYQWVRIEAETTATISWGLFLARLNPGAKLVFEQTRVNDELWLPRREFVSGSARLGLVKKLSVEQELVWSNYRKFQVDSKIIATQ
jgi:hypothetical protein